MSIHAEPPTAVTLTKSTTLTTDLPAKIDALLAAPRSPGRDSSLHTTAAALFEAIGEHGDKTALAKMAAA
jgi:hypothetical protein